MSHREEEGHQLVRRWMSDPMSTELEGPYKSEAGQAEDLFTTYKKQLVHGRFGDQPVLFTPEARFAHKTSEGTADGSVFLYKPKSAPKDSSLSCFIELSLPDEGGTVQYRLSLDPATGLLSETDNTFIAFNDKALLDAAIDSLRKELSSRVERVQKARKKLVKSVSITAGILTVAGAVSGGIMGIIDYKDSQAAHARQVRENYDASGPHLPGRPVDLADMSEPSTQVIPETQLSQIPKLQDGEALTHPRRITIDADACDTFLTKVPRDSTIRIATTAKYAKSLVAARDANGELVICASDLPESLARDDIAVQAGG